MTSTPVRMSEERDMQERRALRPDAQAFDEVRIFTVPRYKTSGLSGDEWRISATIQFFRKGKLIFEKGRGSVEYALRMADADFIEACDSGQGFFAGEEDICDQEGCSAKSTVTYKLKKEYCRGGHETDPYEFNKSPLVRKFCERHSTRGDCGLEDADINYEIISGERNQPSGIDVRESQFGGVIRADENLVDKLNEIRDKHRAGNS